jgi:hypothetical protein
MEQEPFGPREDPAAGLLLLAAAMHSVARASSSSGLNPVAAAFNIAGAGSSALSLTARLHFSNSEDSSDEASLTHRLWEM